MPPVLPQADVLGPDYHVETISLPDAFATVSDNPARAAGLHDRGRLEPGLRADIVCFRDGDAPAVRAVWSEGRRVV